MTRNFVQQDKYIPIGKLRQVLPTASFRCSKSGFKCSTCLARLHFAKPLLDSAYWLVPFLLLYPGYQSFETLCCGGRCCGVGSMRCFRGRVLRNVPRSQKENHTIRVCGHSQTCSRSNKRDYLGHYLVCIAAVCMAASCISPCRAPAALNNACQDPRLRAKAAAEEGPV